MFVRSSPGECGSFSFVALILLGESVDFVRRGATCVIASSKNVIDLVFEKCTKTYAIIVDPSV